MNGVIHATATRARFPANRRSHRDGLAARETNVLHGHRLSVVAGRKLKLRHKLEKRRLRLGEFEAAPRQRHVMHAAALQAELRLRLRWIIETRGLRGNADPC